MSVNDKSPARVTGWSSDSVTVSRLLDSEKGLIEGAIDGKYWVRANEKGRLEHVPTYEDLPDPRSDDTLLPHWRGLERSAGGSQGEMIEKDFECKEHQTPSFIIQHLCGHRYTDELYQHNAELLIKYGFSVMRSQGGLDGKFWETWFLPGIWSARGDLKRALEDVHNKDKTEVAVKFLCRNVSFGTLDLATQAAAMRNPD